MKMNKIHQVSTNTAMSNCFGPLCKMVTKNTSGDIKRLAKDIQLKNHHPYDKNDESHANYDHVDDTKKKYPPKFRYLRRMFPTDIKPAGSNIKLKCVAEGNPTPNITWYKNKITPIQRTYFQPVYRKWFLTLDELSKSDEGNYTCVVCNELRCIEHNVELFVQEHLYAKPVLTQGVVNQTKVIGETARFSCKFSSDMHPYIFWMYFSKDAHVYSKSGDNVGSSSQEIVYLDISKIVSSEDASDKTEQLTIFNVTKEDEGWYVCVGINSLGNTSHTGYLTILEERLYAKPVLTQGVVNQTKVIGETARFSCKFSSDMHPYIFWMYFSKDAHVYSKSGDNVGSSSQEIVYLDDGKVLSSEDASDKPEQLTIFNVTKEDEGWYVCVGLNPLGNTSHTGYLTILKDDTETVTEESLNENLQSVCNLEPKNQTQNVHLQKNVQSSDEQSKRVMQQISLGTLKIEVFLALDASAYTFKNEENKIKKIVVSIKHTLDEEHNNLEENNGLGGNAQASFQISQQSSRNEDRNPDTYHDAVQEQSHSDSEHV